MFGFIALVAAATITIIFVLVFSAKLKMKSWSAWLGALLMLASGLAGLLNIQIPDFICAAAFALGLILFLSGFYSFAANASRPKNGQDSETQARMVADILQVAAARESLIELLNYSLDRILEVFSLNSGAIHIFHQAKNVLVMGSYRGLTPTHAKKLELIRPGQNAIGRTVENKRLLIIRDLRVSPDFEFFGGKSEGYSFLAVTPVMVEGDCWGVITLLGRKKYHRGMLNVPQLEQFGLKLGQALVLGRENRRMSAAFNRYRNLADFYNLLLAGLKTAWQDQQYWQSQRLFKSLAKLPLRLFGGKPFCLYRIFQGVARCVYVHDTGDSTVIGSALANSEFSAKELPTRFKAGGFFGIDSFDLARLIPEISFSGEKLAGYGFSFNDEAGGLIVIEESDLKALSAFTEDVILIGNLFIISYLKSLPAESLPVRAETPQPEYAGVPEELSTIFEIINGHVQLLLSQLKQPEAAPENSELGRRLAEIEDVLRQGSSLLERLNSRNNANEVIQSVLTAEQLNVAFYPGDHLPRIKGDIEGFRRTIQEVLKGAIAENRPIRLKSSSQNHSIALTIEGDVQKNFPTPELQDRARKFNLQIDIAGLNAHQSSPNKIDVDSESSGRISSALVVENRPVIAELLTDFFAQVGYQIKAVSSGREAISYMEGVADRAEPVDVAVIDMTLDDFSGLELCRKIKEMNSQIYTVIISSWGVNLYKNTLDDAGVDAVLHKPFRLEQFKAALQARTLKNATGL